MLVTQWPKPGKTHKPKSGFPQKVKDAVDEEFGGMCVLCPRPRVTHHHIFPRGMGGSRKRDEWWNAAPICQACHDEVEHGKRTRELKDLLRAWATRRREIGKQDGARPAERLI